MEPKKLLTADYLDIIYDNRNQNYGSYELRRHYNSRVRKALVVALTGVAALFSFSFITSNRKDNVHLQARVRPDSVSVIIIPVHPPDIPKIIPPPPAPPQHFKTPTFTAPVIVTDKDIPPDKQMTENKDLANTQPGPANQHGDSTGLAPGPNTGTGTSIGEPVIPKSNEPVRFVEQMPQFAGDMYAYIGKHIHYPESATSAGIEGTVMVEFVVNEDGSVSNAKVIRGIGGGCDEEALSIVNKMPKWKPGKQNGVPVKVFFTLPIKFKLE